MRKWSGNSLVGEPTSIWTRARQSVDWVVVTIVFTVASLAIINLNSAGAGDWTGRVATQLKWFGLGTVVMFLVTALDYKSIYRFAYPAYAFGVLLLALVPFFGIMVNNSRRWLGWGEFRLQPSELMKVLVILAVARYLHDVAGKDKSLPRQLIVPFILVLIPFVLIVRQPDLGTAMLVLMVSSSLLALTGLRLRSMLGLLTAGVLSAALGWRYMADYQRKRVDVWLNPELYADNEGYQTMQALIGVGNGGFFGRGVSKGSQVNLGFLPEPFTDFPFAVYAEEWGFIGTAMVIVLYLCLTLWAINIAAQAKDRFGALACAGVAALLFWHIAVNIGMVLQIVPVSGITLPFFSFGGSNVLTVMASLGILMSVSRSRQVR